MSYQTQHLQIPRIQINTAKRNGEPEQQRVKHGGIGLTTRIARQRTPARSLKRCLKLQPNHRHDTLWYLCQPNAMGFMVSRRILVRLSFTAACTRAIIHSIK
ncbi:hypothetical protein PC129_g20750 [Phytophthora cactorum]|uniref:Uncharacterized protein n=1 Tax=Phytophthora cactorum TaxID=29920 RepID=A0A8T1H7Q4_9STRA|nr:hypothetical protein PC128_g24065 [Phytophthora cactorum]KAG3208223.1 hypothetical protein PC129_g20750 [Phytophthora cactorum]KAG4041586.1 hypothetical protein PC123_g22905 [Phytophthora cactorum]